MQASMLVGKQPHQACVGGKFAYHSLACRGVLQSPESPPHQSCRPRQVSAACPLLEMNADHGACCFALKSETWTLEA